jgi:hypothetical protein
MARKDAAFAFSLFGHNREHVVCNQTRYVWITLNPFNLDVYYNILSLSGGVRPFHPSVASSVPSSIHPGFSSRKKKMMEEEEEDEWRQQQFVQMFM